MYLPKDFLVTAEGLAFAVVAQTTEEDRVLSFLRYQRCPSGWQKLSTEAANNLLAQHYPAYRYYSKLRDTTCHAVPFQAIKQHIQPRQRLQQLINSPATDKVCQDLLAFLALLAQYGIDLKTFGITGSILLGAQTAHSDIDLVIYDQASFQQTRTAIATLTQDNKLKALTEADWLSAYERRDCDLSFSDYVWHEQRKYNKTLIKNRKVDISLLTPLPTENNQCRKLGPIKSTLCILDDTQAFAYPAQWLVTGDDIQQIVCYTATYTGQAINGEWIEVAGQLEQTDSGLRRIVVGASREAPGEYIRVCRQHA